MKFFYYGLQNCVAYKKWSSPLVVKRPCYYWTLGRKHTHMFICWIYLKLRNENYLLFFFNFHIFYYLPMNSENFEFSILNSWTPRIIWEDRTWRFMSNWNLNEIFGLGWWGFNYICSSYTITYFSNDLRCKKMKVWNMYATQCIWNLWN